MNAVIQGQVMSIESARKRTKELMDLWGITKPRVEVSIAHSKPFFYGTPYLNQKGERNGS